MSPPRGSIDQQYDLVLGLENAVKIKRRVVRRHRARAANTGEKSNRNSKGTKCRFHIIHSIRFVQPARGSGGGRPVFNRAFCALEPRNATQAEKVASALMK